MDNPKLDEFGKLMMEYVRDKTLRKWENVLSHAHQSDQSSLSRQRQDDFTALALSDAQVEILRNLIHDMIDGTIHNILFMFEDYAPLITIQVKDEDGKLVDLRELTTGDLQGYTRDWAKRFSKYPVYDRD